MMTMDEFRRAFEAFRSAANDEAIASKVSQEAYFQLSSFYARLDAREREMANEVLSEWVVSDDDSKRWDAQALIHDHDITSTLPALRQLQDQLEASDTPSAPYEWAKVNRLIAHLTQGSGEP